MIKRFIQSDFVSNVVSIVLFLTGLVTWIFSYIFIGEGLQFNQLGHYFTHGIFSIIFWGMLLLYFRTRESIFVKGVFIAFTFPVFFIVIPGALGAIHQSTQYTLFLIFRISILVLFISIFVHNFYQFSCDLKK